MAAFTSLNTALESIEVNCLNELSHCPITSTPIGILRACLAVTEIVGGVAMITFALLAILFDQDTSYLYAELGQFYFLHGCANLARGIVEFIPGINILTSGHDDHRDGRFSYINNQRINALLRQPALV